MALMVWDETYSVNVKRCDQEHQKLFSLLNALHQAMMVGGGRSVVVPVIDELSAYTKTHFGNEEALLEKTAYPGLAGHRVEHQKFVVRVEKLQDDIENGRGANPIEVANFLRDWLATHIKRTDRLYSAHLNAKGVN